MITKSEQLMPGLEVYGVVTPMPGTVKLIAYVVETHVSIAVNL